jgi:hypothetical protein
MIMAKGTWITKAAAAAALVGGLGGVAQAGYVVSAGGFPGEAVSSGTAACAITNTGTRDIIVNSVALLDGAGGAVSTQGAGPIIHPTQTRLFTLGGFVGTMPSGCTFDVNTKTGLRAAFVYRDGSTTVVIPATR